jgi:hypothetical protein
MKNNLFYKKYFSQYIQTMKNKSFSRKKKFHINFYQEKYFPQNKHVSIREKEPYQGI